LTIVVLLILGLVWAAVLGPSLLRRKFDRRSNDSIGEFHQHLRVLRRTGPVVVAPAFRLMTSLPEDPPRRAPDLSPAAGRRLVLIRPDATAPRLQRAASAMQRPDRYCSPEACKRRRDVLAIMACVIFATGVLGAIPLLRPLLVVTALAVVSAVVYVVMIVRLGGRAAERAAKLRYLPVPVEDEPSILIRRVAR